MLNLAVRLAAGVYLLVVAYFVLGVIGGLAAEACRGQSIIASWYGPESGHRTATGAKFTGNSFTAAMPSRKHLGERWRVTYRSRSVVVLINDIGPAARLHRGIDLSRAAARRIGLIPAGVGPVCTERLR